MKMTISEFTENMTTARLRIVGIIMRRFIKRRRFQTFLSFGCIMVDSAV